MGEANPRSIRFQILPATADDFYALAEVEAVSNLAAAKVARESNITYLMFGHPKSGECNKDRARGLNEMLRTDPAMKNYKAVVQDDNGQDKIVAWAQWGFYTEVQPIKDWTDREWPETANAAACNGIIAEISSARKKHMSGKTHAFLQVLATLPEYRCQGIASTMLKQGISEAKEKGLNDFFLTASADGHDLYVKYGFRDIEHLDMDLERYGGVGDARIIAMGRFD
ncbi:uncharacterized protein N7483_009161 [Penicillium malachiteum]|uniref:uncharacterized protein n=1 Tax=Penicillium malachiteum TaxID=1324776 RepID=UPI002547D7FD|nr:uncharacterized protein N7483_009161 [Penicillium malachiteum]KAJ5721227.1 hypothetical protein N7483_009161 [Penicillium malachiteum]